MPLTGTFPRAVDDKQRITIPKDLRATLSDSQGGIFYMAPGTDGSLAVYEEQAFVSLADRLAAAPPAERDVRAFGRLFYARARRVEIDKQGRLRIPPELAQWAEMGKDVVLVGVGDHMEIWNSEKWGSYTAEKQPNYDELAEAALNYPSKPK